MKINAIDPQNQSIFEQADRMLKNEKCVGIKLHPRVHKFDLNEYGDRIFSFAEKYSAIVQIHPQWTADYVAFADIEHHVPSELSFSGRTGSAKENADLICFLASENAAYINGQNIQIDGCRKKQ